MKFVKWLIILIAVLLGVFLLITILLPKDYAVQRSIVIEAPAEVIYSQVVDLEAWQEWNPWNEMDPDMEISYGESTTGEGASYIWVSEVAGNGSMEIIEATPFEAVRYELKFEGWEDLPSYSSILLESIEVPDGTEVTWTIEGTVGKRIFARWMSVLMDKFVGANYEKGLQTLKDRCEEMDANSENPTTVIPPG